MKKRSTLAKRRVIGIIVAAVLVAALAVTLALVLDYVNGEPVEDPADGTVYYVREKDDVYALYDTDRKTVMPTEEQYGYYVTHAGTLVDVDEETGEWEIKAVVDTEGNEELGFNQRVLMFPHLQKTDILQLDVHNSEGDFTFVRLNEKGKVDASGDFVIKGAELNAYDQEKFASLYVSAGYTLTTRKIKDPIKDENGEFSEYGLVPETREREIKDEKGNFVINEAGDGYVTETYEYEPAHYVLTDVRGNKHKVIIGDLMVTGGGYYVQYVNIDADGNEEKRDAVYVLAADIGDTMLVAVEDFVTPQLTYPMTMNTYFDVENFTIENRDHSASGKDYLSPTVGFSYIDLTLRENTINASQPYNFLEGFGLAGYTPDSNSIDACLQGIYSPAYVKVVKLSPSLEDFIEYGLAREVGTDENGDPMYKLLAEHRIVFSYDVLDEGGKVAQTLRHTIHITEPTKTGSRYAFTEIVPLDENGNPKNNEAYDYNSIIEVEGHSLQFLSWDEYDWINPSYVNLNIAFCEKITLETSDYSATFELDNSAWDGTDAINSTNLVVNATDSNGNTKKTFAEMKVTDKDGNLWVITASEIKCYGPAGNELKIKTASYDYNVMGTQVRVVSGAIPAADGSKVYVTANEIEVVTGEGSQKILRYDTNLFRSFYQTLLYASISDSYVMSAEDEAALIGNEENLLLTMTVTNTEGETKVYKFYSLTSRKAYITVNGNGGFYVLTGRVEKFVSDAQRFFANELIDATAKN